MGQTEEQEARGGWSVPNKRPNREESDPFLRVASANLILDSLEAWEEEGGGELVRKAERSAARRNDHGSSNKERTRAEEVKEEREESKNGRVFAIRGGENIRLTISEWRRIIREYLFVFGGEL